MRYKIEKSQNKPGYWVCSDLESNMVCIFEDKNLNNNQKTVLLYDVNPDPLELARIAREMCDWLGENHYDKIF